MTHNNPISLIITTLLCVLSVVANGQNQLSNIHLINTTNEIHYAGTLKQLEYAISNVDKAPLLLVKYSYGKTIIKGELTNTTVKYQIPNCISEKTGTVSLQLIHNGKSLKKHNITITPNPKTITQIENYLGPRTILAEPEHFTMLVSVPTDVYDNPKLDGTPTTLKTQYKAAITTTELKVNDFVAWKKIYSHKKKGKLLVSTYCEYTSSKSIETEIQANIATSFKLNYTRNHKYADGNQITTVSSDIIRDKYDNIVNDGTFVNFIIENNENNLLRSYGSTVNGIARTQILHPDHKETFSITAYVAGMAESNSIKISYDPVTTTIPYHIDSFERTIVVGPIKSYMNQIIPDGVQTTIKIYHKGELIDTLRKNTFNGYVKVIMDPNYYPKQHYSAEITTLGNSINIPRISYEN